MVTVEHELGLAGMPLTTDRHLNNTVGMLMMLNYVSKPGMCVCIQPYLNLCKELWFYFMAAPKSMQ